MIVHDYPAKVRRTFEDLEKLALNLREKWGIASTVRVDVFELLFSKMPDALSKTGLSLVSRAPGFMGERDAYAAPKSKRIFYRAVASAIRFGNPNASLIFLHEVAHFLIHPGAEKAWLTSGNQRPKFIADEESTEWQATTLALCMMAPSHLAKECLSSSSLAKRFALDAENATQHFDQLSKRRPRKMPKSYQKVRTELQKSAHMNANFINEICPECGLEQLMQIDNMYRCANCGRTSDLFQDGDVIF